MQNQSHLFPGFLTNYLQATRLQHQYPSNPRPNRNLNRLLCKYHHQHLCHNRVHNRCQEFESGDYLGNPQYHLDWCLVVSKNQEYRRYRRLHRTCQVIHRCHRLYLLSPECHHYRYLGLQN